MSARSKAEVGGRSPTEIVGSNPIGGMSVRYECCVLSVRGLLRRADHSSREFLPTVVRR